MREIWLLSDTDQIVSGVHSADACTRFCVIHKPSDHWMRDDQLGFDVERKAFYRTCKHGAQHHDPDERTYWMNKLESTKHMVRQSALERLTSWACPNCECSCCDLTAKAE